MIFLDNRVVVLYRFIVVVSRYHKKGIEEVL